MCSVAIGDKEGGEGGGVVGQKATENTSCRVTFRIPDTT